MFLLLLLHFSRSRSWLCVNPTIWNLSSVSALRKVPFLVKSLYSSSPIQDIYSTLKIRSIPFSSANLLKFVSQLQEFLFLSHFFLSSQPFPFLGRKERKKEEIKRKKEETNSHFFFLDLSEFVLHFVSLILPFSFTFFLLSKKSDPYLFPVLQNLKFLFFFSFLTPWEKYKRSSLFDPGGLFFLFAFHFFLFSFFLSFHKRKKREKMRRESGRILKPFIFFLLLLTFFFHIFTFSFSHSIFYWQSKFTTKRFCAKILLVSPWQF